MRYLQAYCLYALQFDGKGLRRIAPSKKPTRKSGLPVCIASLDLHLKDHTPLLFCAVVDTHRTVESLESLFKVIGEFSIGMHSDAFFINFPPV